MDVPVPVDAAPADADEHGAARKKVPAPVVEQVTRLAPGLLRNHRRDERREPVRFVVADPTIKVNEIVGLVDECNAACSKCGRTKMLFEGFF